MSENQNKTYQNMKCSKSSALRGIFSYKCLYLKRNRISKINYLTSYLKLQKQQTKCKASRMKKIIKFGAEISKIHNEKTI